jgi:hypothetical protein
VPVYVSGKLTILASGDLGARGVREGVPVHFDWNLRNNLPVLYMWLPLVCLLFLPENRNKQAWFILVPLLVLLALYLILRALPVDFREEDLFMQIALGYGVGLASAALVSGRLLINPGGLRIFGTSFVLCVVIGLSAVDSSEFMPHVMMCTILGVITLFTLLFARSLCKRGFRVKRFFGCFVLGTIIFGTMFALMWMMLMEVLMHGDFPPVLLLLSFMLIMSGIHLALLTPYLVLMFYNTFWRTRFFGMLSLSHALKP